MESGSGKSFYPSVMHKKILHLLPYTLLIALLFPSFHSIAQQPEQLPSAVIKGDDLYKERQAPAKCLEAIKWYEQGFSERPLEETAVRLAKSYYWLGEHSPQDAKLELFQKGIDWSKKAIEINPKSAGGYLWLGVNNGKCGEAKGILKSLFLVGPIKDAMQQVIAINPSYNYGGAYRVLGRMYFKLPRFAGGGMDKSISHLKKAIEYGPEATTNHVFLAEAYVAQKEYNRARQELNFVLQASLIPGLEPEGKEDKAAAQRLLVDLNKNAR